MKHRMTALALALSLSVSLTACGGQTDPAPGDSLAPSPDTTQAVTQAPTPDPAPSVEAPVLGSDVTPIPDEGTPSSDSGVSPAPTQGAAVGEPTAEPAAEPEPSDVASIAVLAASEVYKAVSKSAGATAATMDASSVMENFYNLSAADLEDYVFYMPELSTNIEEIFIARAKEGKVDAVKAACQSRLGGLKEEAEFYPATGAYVADAKLVSEGSWVLFCVCPDSAGAVKAFLDCLK